jgi:hypothetical protein
MPKRRPLSYNNDELTAGLKKSTGQGMDVFFAANRPIDPSGAKPTDMKKEKSIYKASPPRPVVEKTDIETSSATPRDHGTEIPRNLDTTTPRYHDSTIISIRSAVRKFGKEAATHRFTQDEKRALGDVIHQYRQQDIKTSENEIARIAINFLLQDFEEQAEESILAKTLKALKE